MSLATTLTNNIIDYIFRQGGYSWRASSVGVFDTKRQQFRTAAKKGVADVLACYHGRLVAVEVKIGSDRLSDEQRGFIENIVHCGGVAFVATSFEDFVKKWDESTYTFKS